MPNWQTVEPPEGWRWNTRPQVDYGDPGALELVYPPGTSAFTLPRDVYTDYVKNVVAWHEELEDTVLRPYNIVTSNEGDTGAGAAFGYPTVFYVYPFNDPTYQEDYWPERTCRHGHNHGRAWTDWECTHGDTPEKLACAKPGCFTYHTLYWVEDEATYYCARHCHTCSIQDCGRHYIRQQDSTGMRQVGCNLHDPAVTCDHCESIVWTSQMVSVYANGQELSVCDRCASTVCSECNRIGDAYYRDDDSLLCDECVDRREADSVEIFEEVAPDQPILALEAHPLRPVRTCSIELETTGGGAILARELQNEGLTTYGSVAEYHHGARYAPGSFCYVERDSSIGHDGGELIIDRVNLDIPEEVEKLSAALGVVRRLRKNNTLSVNLQCGTHITVDGHRFGIGDVRNLVLVTNYIEDIIYRLSAANYKYHRGVRYAQPVDKGPFPTDQEFGVRFFTGNGHRSALNVSSYWNAIRDNCGCGASLVGRHAACTCNLGKCAFEFRFFNGTTNFRNLHAWVALCQSLVSFAKASPDLIAESYAPMEYIHEPYRTDFSAKFNAWDERLRWMFKNLYFGPTERESLQYAIEHCTLAELGETRLRDIYATEFNPPAELALDQEIVKLDRNGTTTPRGATTAGLSNVVQQYANDFITTFNAPSSIVWNEDDNLEPDYPQDEPY